MSHALKNTPSTTPDPDVADPHPGSVSDGTHPEADETARVRKDGAGVESRIKRRQAVDPAVMPGGDPAGAA